jgi:uroporphyrin-III C-methyltransferase
MTVYLVGAGPGDPGLLTVRAAELLARAEVVVHDRLTTAPILRLASPGALLVDVGKSAGTATMPQTAINAMLVEHGRRLPGGVVVRLKGGDPYVFGRGGEEAQVLLAAGVDVEVVPGISSALAAPALAGVPVTMRHQSSAFTVLTGHEDASGTSPVDWEAHAATGATLVILMGVGRIAEIAARLMCGGRDPATPVAAVHWASTDRQHVHRSTLGEIGDAELHPPCTIVVGEVAALDLRRTDERCGHGSRRLSR